jgi:hypothetical protein
MGDPCTRSCGMSSTLVEMLPETAAVPRSAFIASCPPARGPIRDHTLCTMLNDLRVPERHVVRISRNELRRPGKSLFRYFLGVKWSQVQILSARLAFSQIRACFYVLRQFWWIVALVRAPSGLRYAVIAQAKWPPRHSGSAAGQGRGLSVASRNGAGGHDVTAQWTGFRVRDDPARPVRARHERLAGLLGESHPALTGTSWKPPTEAS